jgi:hypothetical protein
MNKMFIWLVVIATCAGCSGTPRIKVQLDPFSRAKVATLEMRHPVSMGKVERAVVRYERSISEKENSSLTVYFEIVFKADRNYTSMRLLDETAQVRIDDVFYAGRMADQKVLENKTCGGFGFIVCSTVYTVTERAVLNKEMEKKILSARHLMYQFKTIETIVLDVSPRQLDAIKELLSLGYADLK